MCGPAELSSATPGAVGAFSIQPKPALPWCSWASFLLFCLQRGTESPISGPAGIPFLRSSHRGTKQLLCPGGKGRTQGCHPTALPWDAAPKWSEFPSQETLPFLHLLKS